MKHGADEDKRRARLTGSRASMTAVVTHAMITAQHEQRRQRTSSVLTQSCVNQTVLCCTARASVISGTQNIYHLYIYNYGRRANLSQLLEVSLASTERSRLAFVAKSIIG